MKTAHQEAIRQLAREGQDEMSKSEISGSEYESECLDRYNELVVGLKVVDETRPKRPSNPNPKPKPESHM